MQIATAKMHEPFHSPHYAHQHLSVLEPCMLEDPMAMGGTRGIPQNTYRGCLQLGGSNIFVIIFRTTLCKELVLI